MSLDLGDGKNNCRRHCSLVDRSSDLGETTFSLEEFVSGGQLDNQTSESFASSKPVFLQMSCKPEATKMPAKDENKQFDPGEKREEPPL